MSYPKYMLSHASSGASRNLIITKDAYFLTWNPKISGKQPFSAFPKNFPYFLSFQEKKASFWGGDKNYHPRVVHALL